MEDSNPRPNKQYANFLRSYFAIGFVIKADSKQPTLRLSSNFRSRTEVFGTYFHIFYASKSNVAEQNFRETSCFLTILRENANPTKLRIKQQEQTLRCQLNFVAKGLKRSRYGSLHPPLVLLSKPVNPNF